MLYFIFELAIYALCIATLGRVEKVNSRDISFKPLTSAEETPLTERGGGAA
jgi:hypothetical protein